MPLLRAQEKAKVADEALLLAEEKAQGSSAAANFSEGRARFPTRRGHF